MSTITYKVCDYCGKNEETLLERDAMFAFYPIEVNIGRWGEEEFEAYEGEFCEECYENKIRDTLDKLLIRLVHLDQKRGNTV